VKGPTTIVHHKESRRIILCSCEAVVLEQKLVLPKVQCDGWTQERPVNSSRKMKRFTVNQFKSDVTSNPQSLVSN